MSSMEKWAVCIWTVFCIIFGKSCSLIMFFFSSELGYLHLKAWRILKRLASHTVSNWWIVPWDFISQMLSLRAGLLWTVSLFLLMMRASNLENNLDLKKTQAAADIFPFLLWVGIICLSGMVVPLTLIGPVPKTPSPKCLHFHLLIHL